MIFTERTITVKKGVSSINEPVILYRGDYDVEIRFTIKNSKFRFFSQTNLIESEKAAYAQLAIIKPDGENVFSDIAKCEEGTVAFVLTSEMIDELHDVGLYSFQIRLYDQDKESRASIPPIEYGIEIREPIASEDHTNVVDEALVGYSIAKVTSLDEEPVGPTFDEDDNYNVTNWETGDRITEDKLNKIEDALNTLNQNEKNLDRKMLNNYNVLNASKVEKNELLVEKHRIDNLAKLPAGSTAGDAELMDIRVDIRGAIHDTAGKAVRSQVNRALKSTNDIINEIGEKIFEVIEFDEVEIDKVYSAGFPNGTTLNYARSYKKNVSPGEVYKVSSTVYANSEYALAYLYDATGTLKYFIERNTEAVAKTYNEYEILIPDDITLMIMSSPSTAAGMMKIMREKIQLSFDVNAISDVENELQNVNDNMELVKEDVENIQNVIRNIDETLNMFEEGICEKIFENEEFDVIEENKVYSAGFPNGTTLNYTRSYKKNVSPGEVYRLSSATFANVEYALAYLYDESGVLRHFIAKNTEAVTKTYYDYEIVIPDGICLMIVSIPNAYYNILRLLKEKEKISLDIGGPIGYEFKDGVLNISYKMGEDTDFVVELKQKGGNNIFDFYSEAEIVNPLKYPGIDFQNKSVIYSHTTDWHCPYIVAARNNGDGDNKNDNGVFNYYFTGGNHQYNNQGSGSTTTGRTTSVRVFIDGREIHSESGYAMNNIEVRWVNLVQGYNTTKSDGSGREILQENHTLIFDGRVFHSNVEIVPLEDISMERWYGFQCSRGTVFGTSTQFIGGSNRQIMTSDLSSVNCGTGKASTMIHKGPKYGLKLMLDTTYDVGSMETHGNPFAFNSGDKSYFNLTTGMHMNTGDRYHIRGTYEFFVI